MKDILIRTAAGALFVALVVLALSTWTWSSHALHRAFGGPFWVWDSAMALLVLFCWSTLQHFIAERRKRRGTQ